MEDDTDMINSKVWTRLARKFPKLRYVDSMFDFWSYLVIQRGSEVDAERVVMTASEEELDLIVMVYKMSLEPIGERPILKWSGFKDA